MSAVLNLLGHFVVLATVLGLTWCAFVLTTSVRSVEERTLRTLSVACGFVIFLGAKAAGVDIPTVVFEAGGDLSLLALVLRWLAPGLTGFFAAELILRALRRRDDRDVPVRVMLLFLCLVLFQTADIYVALLDRAATGGVNRNLIPNLVFVAALTLDLITKWPVTKAAVEAGAKWRNL